MIVITSLVLLLSTVAFATSLIAIEVSFRTGAPQYCPRWAAGLSSAFFVLALDAVLYPEQFQLASPRHIAWFGVCAASLVMVILSNRAHIMRTKFMRNIAKRRREKNATRNAVKERNACFSGKSLG